MNDTKKNQATEEAATVKKAMIFTTEWTIRCRKDAARAWVVIRAAANRIPSSAATTGPN